MSGPQPGRKLGRPTPDSRWIPAIAVGLAIVSWEVTARLGLIPGFLFSSPTTVLATLGRSIASGEMLENLLATILRVIPGLLLGGIPGLMLGIGMGLSNRLRQALDPLLAAVHPIPKIAILPLVMIFLGVGEASRIAVASLASFFPMLINTMAGIRQIEPIYFQVAENYGASRLKVLTRVVLPGSLPFVLSGLRLAANLTLLVTISAEIVMADVGLGSLVWLAWETLRVELLYATLIVISLLGVTLTASLRTLQRSMAPWQLTEAKR